MADVPDIGAKNACLLEMINGQVICFFSAPQKTETSISWQDSSDTEKYLFQPSDQQKKTNYRNLFFINTSYPFKIKKKNVFSYIGGQLKLMTQVISPQIVSKNQQGFALSYWSNYGSDGKIIRFNNDDFGDFSKVAGRTLFLAEFRYEFLKEVNNDDNVVLTPVCFNIKPIYTQTTPQKPIIDFGAGVGSAYNGFFTIKLRTVSEGDGDDAKEVTKIVVCDGATYNDEDVEWGSSLMQLNDASYWIDNKEFTVDKGKSYIILKYPSYENYPRLPVSIEMVDELPENQDITYYLIGECIVDDDGVRVIQRHGTSAGGLANGVPIMYYFVRCSDWTTN